VEWAHLVQWVPLDQLVLLVVRVLLDQSDLRVVRVLLDSPDLPDLVGSLVHLEFLVD